MGKEGLVNEHVSLQRCAFIELIKLRICGNPLLLSRKAQPLAQGCSHLAHAVHVISRLHASVAIPYISSAALATKPISTRPPFSLIFPTGAPGH